MIVSIIIYLFILLVVCFLGQNYLSNKTQYYPKQYYWTFLTLFLLFITNTQFALFFVSSIFFEFFLKLFFETGREVLQIAKRGKYAIGDVINTHKAWSEKFYVVAAGVVEARILKEDEEEGTNGEHRGSIGK